jgi:cation diffusion facilitator family transporter
VISQIRHIPRAEATAAMVSLIVSVVLLLIKALAYYYTGSAAIFSDALEQIVNVLASAFAGYSLYLAHQPADALHPYGHGKVEFFSAGFEGGMILLAAVVIAFRASDAIVHHARPEQLDMGFLLIALAGGVNGAVGLFLMRSARVHHSITLEADGKHLLSDAITSIAVLVALALIRLTGWTWIDPLAALLVAAYLAWVARGLLGHSAAGLMDTQDAADEAMLRKILDAHLAPSNVEPTVCSYHKLRHRHSGRYHWVDFHLVVPATWDIAHGHEVASKIEHEIERALVEGNATAHVEPCRESVCEKCGEKEH